MKHPHADLIKQMVDDDTLLAEIPTKPGEHYKLNSVVAYSDHDWRLVPPKPKTITIVCNGKTYELPEPMRVAPKVGKTFFVSSHAVFETYWDGGEHDETSFRQGRCHATREAAQQWVDAMSEIRGAK